MIFWQNHTLAKWYFGKIILWQNDIVAKQYFWQNHILGYTLAAFQTNTLLKANDFANWFTIRLRRTARCAKDGARLARVLSSRVPGRRDAAVHEHALKSRAAHGFPCKNRSAKLEFEMFWSWNHVSWSFYRFMLRDKRHCSQVLWFDRHTAPTGKKTHQWHLFDWLFSF